ncbi:lysostaphin resistance A-like protein [Algimonas porphyrae]|uniref:CAAX amino protease n=1 Tax=Algimonas porphyrae TaxID=1128113 RepID=A0ABQ5V0A9_9PROT|nr:CPBP family intramembrane glutamic endopeptidase [Algimonas porphyrae]GLQ20863.1 CAAX amino protease [Algimonas porphyrae]
MLVQELINTVVQIMVVLIICAVFWGIFGRKKAGLTQWLGLYRPTRRSMIIAVIIGVAYKLVTIPIYLIPSMTAIVMAEGTVGAKFASQGLTGTVLLTILVMALFKTALAEEILFRGLIAKRLIKAFGLWVGNTVQALIFAAAHFIPFVLIMGDSVDAFVVLAMFILPACGGWMMGYLNEEVGNGSIGPSWALHGFGNLTAYLYFALS